MRHTSDIWHFLTSFVLIAQILINGVKISVFPDFEDSQLSNFWLFSSKVSPFTGKLSVNA